MNYEECKEECEKYGFECTDYFGDVIVRTKYETWKFTPSNGKTLLYHKNTIGKIKRHMKNDYHIEFRDYISPKNLVKYMYEHESAKYTKRYNDFSVNINQKQQQYKKMKMKELQKIACC